MNGSPGMGLGESVHSTSLVLACTICTVLLTECQKASAFVNGFPVPMSRFPFVAALYYWPLNQKEARQFVPFCTGTIATVDWVITTYACIKDETGPIAGVFRPQKLDSPQWIRMLAGSGFSPINESSFSKYTFRTGKDWKFPEVEDLMNVFGWNKTTAEERKSNRYEEKDVKGNVFYRYYLDYAAIKVDEAWDFSPFIETAPFPVNTKPILDTWWSNKVNDTRYGVGFMEPCYAAGWGGWDSSFPQLRMRYIPVRFVPYESCELSYCAECSYCNKSMRVNPRSEACYKATVPGDGCVGDQGAPLWCPWFGYSKTRSGNVFRSGSVLGFLSYATSCNSKSLPSIYHHSWNIYSIISRVRGAQWPSESWLWGDPRA